MNSRTNSSIQSAPLPAPDHERILSSSASNASERVLSPRRFLLTFVGALALLAILVLAAVTATDPSRYFFGSPVPQIWPNSPGRKVELFRKYSARGRVSGLLLGSSRCTLMLPEQADRLTGLRFFNASVFDASTDHFLAMYRLFRRIQSAPPKMLVLGIDTVLLSSSAGVSEDLPANYALSSQLEGNLILPWHFARLYAHYLSMQTFFDLRTSIENWMSPKPPLETYLPDGHLASQETPADRAANYLVRKALTKEGMEPILVKYREFSGISNLRVERLRVLLREASTDGVDVLLWLTPVHPALRAAIDSLPAVPANELRARRIVREMASRFNARIVDLSLPESFGGNPSGWLDTVHVSPADARRELNKLLGSSQD